MAIRLGDIAPDFSAESAESIDGPIRFHEWLGDSWGVLFSHPLELHPDDDGGRRMLARLRG